MVYLKIRTLLWEIRSLIRGKNEKIKDFNIHYGYLYTKLDKKKRKSIGILDNTDFLKPYYKVWKLVFLKGDTITLERAYLLAKKVYRLSSHRTEGPRKNNILLK